MENRRTFIRQIAAAGIAGSISPALFAGENSDKDIRLIVRADDMGNTWGTVNGIVKAYKEGIVTSASVMVPSQFFPESVRMCNENPDLAVGVHLTIVASRTRSVLPPEEVSSILTKEGFFYETLNDLEKANPKPGEIEKEMRAQVQKARDSGLNFVYLDWHRGGGEGTKVAELRKEITKKLCEEQNLIFGQDNEGEMYNYFRTPFIPESWPTQMLPDGQMVYYAAPELSLESQKKAYENLSELKPGNWIVVIHPGWGPPERTSVTKLLCSSEVTQIIKRKNIQLVSYYDLWKEEFDKTN